MQEAVRNIKINNERERGEREIERRKMKKEHSMWAWDV